MIPVIMWLGVPSLVSRLIDFNNEDVPVSPLTAVSAAYYFCFVFKDIENVSAEFAKSVLAL